MSQRNSETLRATQRIGFVLFWYALGGCGVMADPIQPILDDDAAAAELQATGADQEFGTMIPYPPDGVKPTDTPPTRQMQIQERWQIKRQLGRVNQGALIIKSGLDIGAHAVGYEIAGTAKDFVGDGGTFALTDDEINYLYLDADETLKKNTTAYPADCFMLGRVTTASGTYAETDIKHDIYRNFETGLGNAWATIPASQAVDFNGEDLTDVGWLDLDDGGELTVDAGSITPTAGYHQVGGEGAANDVLDTIVATAGKRRFLLLQGNAAEVITLAEGGNIRFGYPTVTLEAYRTVLLFQYSDTHWLVVSPDISRIGILDRHIDGDSGGHGFAALGQIQYQYGGLVIAGGVAAMGAAEVTFLLVAGQGAAADALDQVTGDSLIAGHILYIVPSTDAYAITVKHAIGADKFNLAHETDFVMNLANGPHMLACHYDGTQWVEDWRGPWEPMMMNAIGSDSKRDSVPYTFTARFGTHNNAVALTDKVYEYTFVAPFAFTLKDAIGYVDTAPGGGSCVVDVLHELAAGGGFASIHAGGSEKITILDGTKTDTSSPGNPWTGVIAAGDKLKIEVLGADGGPNGADDLTVIFNGRAPMVDHE